MTLSGAIAALRPDVDGPRRILAPVVVHEVVKDGMDVFKHTRAGIGAGGTVSHVSGSYTAEANGMTEAQRRAAGLRRNGRPRSRTRT